MYTGDLCSEGEEEPCPEGNLGGGSPGTVTPTVTVTCSPSNLALGSTGPTSTTSGNCNTTTTPAGGTFSWSVNKTTVTLNGSGGGASYTASSQSSASGDTIITVQYTVNGQSATAESAGITVHEPTSLAVVSDTTNASGEPCSVTCLNGSSGCGYSSYLRTRTYNVLDQLSQTFSGVGIGAVNAQESFSGFSSTCSANSPSPGSAATSEFGDQFYFCSTACLPGGSGCTNSATRTITVNGLSVRTESVTWTCSGVTLTP